MIARNLVMIMPCVALFACGDTSSGSGQITKDVKNAIALCSTSVSITDSARLELTAQIEETLAGQHSISASAGIESAVRSLAFDEEILKTDSGVKAFEIYNECIQNDLSKYLNQNG